jgi:hypothetical protein
MTVTATPTITPVDNPLSEEPVDGGALDVVGAAPPVDVLVDSSTVQTPFQVSFQLFADPKMVLSLAPIVVAGF